ncbi:MAG: SDR family oxidoreductase [Anaerolineales bacterium]|jgi:NAD(P)-dependent dehydrogenase (short-subunit alcohol dehydrogenase family)|nr:SDR family oxidoreductase [Anaerolineales bacterium]HJO32581.1 SDR family oxidoreductase [Anaerolineales bacterium]
MSTNGAPAMKAVVITGASTGIGRACALHLHALGFSVFAGIRKTADGEALRAATGERLQPVYLDVTDGESIRAAARTVEAGCRDGGLAGLVNNAGIAVAGPLEFLPLDSLRSQLEINVVGQIAVTQALLALLRRAGGRIVNMSSVSGRVAAPFLGPYSASKFALEALSDCMRLELRPWGISVSVVQPGPIATPIWNKSRAATKNMLAELPTQAQQLYGAATRAAGKWERDMTREMPSPMVAARAVEHALTAPRPRTRYRIGRVGHVADLVARFAPDRLRDWLLIRQRG